MIASGWNLSAVIVSMSALSTAAQAAIYTHTNEGSSHTWTASTTWSSGAAADPAHDYVSAKNLRTTAGSTTTFLGKSLTMNAGSSLSLNATTNTANNLVMNGGGIRLNQSTVNSTIAGVMSVSVNTAVNAGHASRTLTIQSTLSGAGNFNVTGVATGTVRANSADTTAFSGDWNVSGADVTFRVSHLNALGSGDLTVASGSIVDFDAAVSRTSGLITLNGTMTLDQNLTFYQFQIGSTAIPAGTYTWTELDQNYGSYFSDTGSGSIKVLSTVPEPSSLVAVAGAGILALGRRRRPA